MSVELAEIARTWMGTPYVHQASIKGAGCDCLGLLRGVWREAYGSEPEKVPPYTSDWAEPQGDEVLLEAAERHLTSVATSSLAVGQIVVFRMKSGAIAKHVGLISDASSNPKFIHAYAGHGVVESPLSLPWRRRIVARFIVS